MKKHCALLILCLFSLSFKAQAQNPAYHNHLYHLCKVWGYVKYFHSEVSDPNCLVNCDDELLAQVPNLKLITSDAEFNTLLLDMLETAGAMDPGVGAPPDTPDSLKINLDLDWFVDPIFSAEVKMKLEEIETNFRTHNICKVGEYFFNGNANFENDNAYYSESMYPDEAKRVLALFRYWNVIKYWYPYHHLLDQHWDSTLVQFIPAIIEAPDILSFQLAFKELTTYINDSHAFYINPYYKSNIEGAYYGPFFTQFIEGEMVVTKVIPAVSSQIGPGDIIKKLDGHDIYALRDSTRKYVHGSNDITIERNLNDFLLFGADGSFEVETENETGTQTMTLYRNGFNLNTLLETNGPAYDAIITPEGCRYVYVNMGILETNQVAQLFAFSSNADAIIFDIRNYPNGTLWNIVNYLYFDPIHIASFTVGDIQFPGTVFWSNEFIGSGTSTPFPGKVLILFNEETQSQAEYTVMGLEQHPGAVKIGSQTAGADGNVSSVFLPGTIKIYFTDLGTYYPDHSETQRIGMVPDIEVHPTIQGIRDGVDEVLEAAYEVELPCMTSAVRDILSREYWNVNISPNPASGLINISLPEKQQHAEATLHSLDGKTLATLRFAGDAAVMDISEIPSGIYLLQVKSEKKVHSERVVKMD